MALNVPGLWFMSWYDVSVGPNLEMFNHVRRTAKPPVRDQQWAIIAPVAHCAYTRATENTIVGEREHGRRAARLQRHRLRLLRQVPERRRERAASRSCQGDVFTMGSNKWQTSDVWPPAERAADDVLPVERRPRQLADRRRRAGGGAAGCRHAGCVHLRSDESGDVVRRQRLLHRQCDPGGVVRSAQDGIAARHPGLHVGAVQGRLELSGPITPTLYVSSDAKDTDFTVKVLDVYPDGRAYNLDESIQRMRYRDGYEKTVWMEKDKIYKVTLQPLNTSNYFAPGHRLRIEVSSSNFPRFDRNMNTGGNNYDEARGVVARNAVHHSKQYPSSITISVVRPPVSTARHH